MEGRGPQARERQPSVSARSLAPRVIGDRLSQRGERGWQAVARGDHQVQRDQQVRGLSSELDRDAKRQHTEREQRQRRRPAEDHRCQQRDSDRGDDREREQLHGAVAQVAEALGVPQVARHERGSQHEGEDHRRGAHASVARHQRGRRRAARREHPDPLDRVHVRARFLDREPAKADRALLGHDLAVLVAEQDLDPVEAGRRRISVVGPAVPVEHLDAVIALERAAVEKRPHRDPRAIDDPNGRVVAGPPLTPLDPRPLIGVRRERVCGLDQVEHLAALPRLLDQRQRAERGEHDGGEEDPREVTRRGRVGTCLHGRRLPPP